MELTTSWQRVAEGTYYNVNGSNVHANTRLYMKYGDRNTGENRDTIYWEIRCAATPENKSWATYGYGYDEGYSIYDGNTWRASGTYREGSWPSDIVTNTEKLCASGSWTQYHNADGNWSTTLTFNGSVYGTSYTRYPAISLPMIPRQADINSAPNFNTDENPTITYTNSAGNNVTELVAGIFDSNGQRAYAGYRDISKTGNSYTFNLTEAERNALRNASSNDQTSVRFYIRTLIGGTYYYSNLLRTATAVYKQAVLQTATDFTDEENPTITYSNVEGNNVTSLKAYIEKDAYTLLVGLRDVNKTGNLSYTFNLTNEERTTLRQASTSNTLPVRFVIQTEIGGHTYWSVLSRTMTLVNANPTFNDYVFEDINPTTVALTGNDQDVIIGYSNVMATISTANKATANKEATMSKYRFISGTMSADANYSSDSDVNVTLNKVPSGVFNLYAIDNRNNSKSVEKTANNIINYSDITKENISLERTTGVSKETTLTFNGTWWNDDFGDVTNSLTATYKYKKIGESSYITGTTPLTLTISGNNYSFTGFIAGDEGNNGFDINYSYDIQVIVEDELSSATFTAQLSSGIPHIAYAKDGISIMGKYNDVLGGALQIEGQPVFESGSNINGSYIKYADGTMICHKDHDFGSQSFYSSWGSLYETDALSLGNFPVEFVGNYPGVQIMARGAYFIERRYSPSLTSWGEFWAVRADNQTQNVSVSCIAIGKWK